MAESSASAAGCLLHFAEDLAIATRAAEAAGLQPLTIERHRFPDGELRLRLPPAKSSPRLPRAEPITPSSPKPISRARSTTCVAKKIAP